MPSPLHSALQRSKSYWFRDGIPEIVLGTYFALVGVLFAVEAVLGEAGRSVSAYGLPVLIVGGTLSMPAVIEALKRRMTFPRTGYVAYRQARPAQRRTAGLVGALFAIAVVAGVALLTAADAAADLPVAALATGSILSIGFLVAGFRSGLHRLFLVAVVAGVSVTVCASLGADDTLGMAVLFASVGVVQAVLGVIVLLRYLANTSAPGPIDTHEADARDDLGPTTVGADPQDAAGGADTGSAQQRRRA